MSDIKKYPEEAWEVRALVENRRHFMNLVYALATLQTFQLSTTCGWYSYLGEAYFHLADSSEHFIHIVWMFAQLLAVCLLYISIYVRRNAVMGVLIVFYFLATAGKLFQISSFYPYPEFRVRFSTLTRLSEYDVMSLIFDSAMVVTSFLNCFMSAIAMWHFTPLVIVKMTCTDSEESEKARKVLRRARKTRTTSYTVTSSSGSDTMEVSDHESGNSYKTKVVQKKHVRGTVSDGGEVSVSSVVGTEASGGKFNKFGKKIENAPPTKIK